MKRDKLEQVMPKISQNLFLKNDRKQHKEVEPVNNSTKDKKEKKLECANKMDDDQSAGRDCLKHELDKVLADIRNRGYKEDNQNNKNS